MVLCVAMIWQAVGYYMVMYLAGMDGVPTTSTRPPISKAAAKCASFS